eukprot:12933429-Prorocentrum_lima.AAC.1
MGVGFKFMPRRKLVQASRSGLVASAPSGLLAKRLNAAEGWLGGWVAWLRMVASLLRMCCDPPG